ncbi:MAG: DUF4097 family beta strand repeat protein [Bryobacterales bacterium]|nr:DUF4097 family beta strand repeat protein [Bryobacterales bacterium]
MRRGSIIGPIILILIGVAFLLNNMRPDLSLLRIVGNFWPWILIGWGAIRLVEVTSWHMSGRPLPQNGISGGEWVFIVFLCLLGSSVFFGYRMKDRWPDARIRMRGLDILGETYDYPLAEQRTGSGVTPRILIENLRGNARVGTAEAGEIRVSGRNTVRAFSREEADKVNKSVKLELIKQGDLFVIRTNQERAEGSLKVSSDLEITVPKGASVEGRGRFGDFDIADLAGGVAIDSENAGVRLTNIGGNVRVETRKSDVVRVVNCKGNVELKGSGSDVELEAIEGQATVNGNYKGDITLRKLAKPVRFESSRTELRLERLPGFVQMTRGDLSADDVVGPVYLRGSNKDVEITNLTAGVDIQLERGDVTVRPGRLPLGKTEIRTNSGDIVLHLPPASTFKLKAETAQGEIESDFAPPVPEREERGRKGSKFEAVVGSGPEMTLYTRRGQITVRKGSGGAVLPAVPAPPPPPAPSAPKRTSI